MQPISKNAKSLLSSAEIKGKINTAYDLDENVAVEEHLAMIPFRYEDTERVRGRARKMVEHVRENASSLGGVDKFMTEFGLTTKEGIALMCLAEALLRIPDAETANKLISDKIGGADWDKHLGKADDLFVNASAWALALTGKVVSDLESDKSFSVSSIVSGIVSRLGEPVVRRATLFCMKLMGQQFVMGRTIEEALNRAAEDEKQGFRHSFDMLGEGARTTDDAERYFANYMMAIDAIGKSAGGKGPIESPGISIKLSALHPRYEYANRAVCVPDLSARLLQLAQRCASYGIGLTVDAEESSRLEMSMEIIQNAFQDPSLKGWDGFGLAIQAYHKRCSRLIDWLAALCQENDRRMMVRLVKGAYWDSEIKYAQIMGLPGYPVFTRKASTDVCYIACARKLLQRRDIFYPMLATHNAYTISAVIELAGSDQSGFEFQRLHGMGADLYQQIVGEDPLKYPCRVYAPVGSHQDLLPYLVRRLLENGANSNFVSQLQNQKIPVEKMIIDPVAYVRTLGSKPHPKIPLPVNMFAGERKNSHGIEFANSAISAPLLQEVEKQSLLIRSAAPTINGKMRSTKNAQTVTDPADRSRSIGSVSFATEQDLKDALDTTHKGFAAWKKTSPDLRAKCLEKCADLMEKNMAELIAICVREAGKTLPDAVAEVREAVDFCRYYAIEGRKIFADHVLPGPTGESNILKLEGRGVFLCISPWNFPLAIFMGQVAAALMAGNTVIAKPAEQTSLIAQRALELLLESGVPADAIALVPATGEMAGQYLTPDPRIAGVCFTGSTEVAQIINRTLAARTGPIVPLIAETGGQNAMIADSSALPEQIVDDAITSAFRSAGQRCSALRVLYVQDNIADKVIHMLDGASKLLTLGDPLLLSTDIGPVIDETTLKILQSHTEKMNATAKKIAEVPLPASGTSTGVFFAPRAYEIKSIKDLEREVFGPILHVIRYKAEELPRIIDDINGTGYGLTFGVHTRIDHTAEQLCATINAGNCYVNRSMIGAVVGVQPFGGSGLSGTGPKAGGPHYLLRFAGERTVTVNTTASGGNTTLVSLEENNDFA